MKPITTDILVCGGGISGLLTAKSLLNLGLSVVCLEKMKGSLKSEEIVEDGRSTALLQPSINFLSDLGLWRNLSQKSQALESLILCNLSPDKNLIDETCEFSASDLNLATLGFNIPNDFLTSELKKSLISESKFIFLDNVVVQDLVSRSKEIITVTDQGHKITSKLVIGADGKSGSLRELTKIGKFNIDYSQKALVFSIKHELNHKAKSFEIYESGGPCTLVPNKTSKADGYFSSVVLMQNLKEVQKTINLDREELAAFITKRTGNLLGKCKITTKIRKFPIMSQISTRFVGDRSLLLAESAHVMPPIGAQGMNSSIQDIKCLTELLALEAKDNKDFGQSNLLYKFEKARANKIRSRMLGIHILNKVSIKGNGLALTMRKLGLRGLSKNLKLRKFVMNLGMYEKFQTIQ
ncbi:MAG: FAD-dependent monooxygenase [Paracoccaceae bacterium]|nr:FAD-dependent monooxygenase [Paracoccaceae bacterium]